MATQHHAQGTPLSEHDRTLLAQFLADPSEASTAWLYLAQSNLVYSPKNTQWLQNLVAADVRTKTIFDEDDGEVSLGMVAVGDYAPKFHPFSRRMSSTVLFLRAAYFQLFELVFAHHASSRIAVIGNPGTGKSWFQVFIIWNLLRIHKMEADKRPNLFLPTYIVQQLGFHVVNIYDLVNVRMWNATLTDERLLAEFNAENTVYLFDPALDPQSTPRYSTPRAIVTTSPKRDRIHEFMKDGGARFYMPVWSEEELQIAAPWLHDALPADHEMKQLLTPDDVDRRFEQFGGIIRHVLSLHPDYIAAAEADQTAAMKDVSFQQLFDAGEIFDRRVENHSYHIFHYHVSSDLQSFRLKFPCRYVEIQLRARVVEVKFGEALEQLVQAMSGNLPERMRLLLETVTYGLLARNVDVWKVLQHLPYVRPDTTNALRRQLASHTG